MSELVEHFQEYLRVLTEGDAESLPPLSERGLQAATAVLLVQTLRADLKIEEGEIEAVVGAVESILGLEHAEALELAQVAARHVRSGNAMQLALRRLDQCLTRAQRVELVEWLWRIAFADAELAGHEEYLIRKVSGLLSLSTADLVEAKVRAKEAF